MKVLITGAAGAIGSNLVRGLGDRHEIRGLDLVEMERPDDNLVGNVCDMEIMLQATAAGGEEWDNGLNSMIGTYNAFEAARTNGVKRIAYASRGGVLSRAHYGAAPRTLDMLPKPRDFYTISKVFGESIGYMYSARHDMEVIALRIGNFHHDSDWPLYDLDHGRRVIGYHPQDKSQVPEADRSW